MPEQTWTDVDRYISDSMHEADPSLESALESSHQEGLPSIQVTASMGKFMHILSRWGKAKKILEIGTLGGYSTIWLARSLESGGKLITFEADPKHARVARENIARAGAADRVDVREGLALDLLPSVQNEAPFDLFFIDADKNNNPHYFEWAVKMSRPGSLIIVDNVVRDGTVLDAASGDPNTQGVRKLYEQVGKDTRVDATVMQTVGGKGYDGFLIAIVK